MFLTQLLLTAL